MLSSVDLPEPEGPTMASELVGDSTRSTSRSALTGGAMPNVRVMPRSSTSPTARGAGTGRLRLAAARAQWTPPPWPRGAVAGRGSWPPAAHRPALGRVRGADHDE